MEDSDYKKLDQTDIQIFTRIMNRNRKEMWHELGNAGITALWLITCSLNIVISVRHDDEAMFYVWHAIAVIWAVFFIIYLREAYIHYKDMRSAKKALNPKTELP